MWNKPQITVLLVSITNFLLLSSAELFSKKLKRLSVVHLEDLNRVDYDHLAEYLAEKKRPLSLAISTSEFFRLTYPSRDTSVRQLETVCEKKGINSLPCITDFKTTIFTFVTLDSSEIFGLLPNLQTCEFKMYTTDVDGLNSTYLFAMKFLETYRNSMEPQRTMNVVLWENKYYYAKNVLPHFRDFVARTNAEVKIRIKHKRSKGKTKMNFELGNAKCVFKRKSTVRSVSEVFDTP